MTSESFSLTLEELYGAWNEVREGWLEALDRSHNPLSRDMMYDRMAALGCGDSDYVLDIGCWAARHSCVLARRFGCRVAAVDYFESHIVKANGVIEEQGLRALVKTSQGDIHSLGFADGEFDFVWCRDMLANCRDIRLAISECSRVLKPSGKMVIYTDLETDLMESREATRLYGKAVHPQSVSRTSVESALHDAGLVIMERDQVSTEWKERDEEDDLDPMGKEFLRIARMRRSREALISEFGRTMYEAELTGSLWYAYEILGKLMPVVYVVSKPE